MQRRFTIFAVTVAATLATLAGGLAGTAAADDGTFQVTGTGGLGVRVHTGPSPNAPVVGLVPEGNNIIVACQTYGDAVTDPVDGVTSSVWDKLGGGNSDVYVSDLYVNTPGIGYISLTPCDTAGKQLP